VANEEILRPRGTCLGGVIPPWPGRTMLSVTNVTATNVTVNVTRSTVTQTAKVTVNVAVST
jgi:hypothetical protein